MLECLMYLFENYIHSEMNVMMENKALTDELTDAGFPMFSSKGRSLSMVMIQRIGFSHVPKGEDLRRAALHTG